ncbi:MAG: DUF4835 family protein [Bacteroidales bacterium]
MQNAMYEFMNNRVWTDHVYAPEERIEVTMMFNITDQPSADEFKGTLQLQVRRPVFNTNYNTTTLNFVDNDIHFATWSFPPEFDINSHTSNLTSILAFYAYYILGIDYDTFSRLGGSPCISPGRAGHAQCPERRHPERLEAHGRPDAQEPVLDQGHAGSGI